MIKHVHSKIILAAKWSWAEKGESGMELRFKINIVVHVGHDGSFDYSNDRGNRRHLRSRCDRIW